MPPKRSNKTARVLNLIAKSDNEPSDIEASAQDIINSNNNMSEDSVADLLAKHNDEQTQANEPVSNTETNAVLSDDAAVTDLSSQNNQENKSETEQSDIKEQPAQTSAELPPAPQPVVPILQNVREQETQLEEQICSELLSSLEIEEQDTKVQTIPEPLVTNEKATEPVTQSDPNAVMSDDAIAALLTQHNKESEKNNDNPQHVENKVQSTTKTTDNSYIGTAPHGKRSVKYINVIQELVEEEADYSSQMLSCRCPRCLADMKALTLTNLPSKYVVVEDGQKNGLLRIYSSKYSRLISVQIMKSCVIVNENPHH